jgi:hypothetical protein
MYGRRALLQAGTVVRLARDAGRSWGRRRRERKERFNSDFARDEVIERSEAGERMTPAQIKGIVRRGCRPRQNR